MTARVHKDTAGVWTGAQHGWNVPIVWQASHLKHHSLIIHCVSQT